MKFARLFLLSAIVSGPVTIVSARQLTDLELLPSRNRIPPFLADPLVPTFSIQKMFGNEDLIARFGSILPLAQLRSSGIPVQLDAAACAISFLQAPGGGLKLISTDFHFMVNATVEWWPTCVSRIGYGHTSHHLSDDAITGTPALTPTNYSRDYLNADLAVVLPPWHGIFYLGVNYAIQFHVSTISPKQLWVTMGGVPARINLFDSVNLYGAFNLRFRQEFQFATTQNYQVGLEFASQNGRVLRAALDFQTGKDNRGQFYDKPLDIATIGLYFDL